MKRFLIAAVVVLFVGPMIAEDSPLVAAAKKTNRQKPKSGFVITDETLKTMKDGHVTTTAIVYAPPPVLPAAFVPAGAKTYKRTPPPKKTEAAPKRPVDDAEGYLEDDEMPPATPTSTASPATPKASATPQAKKPSS